MDGRLHMGVRLRRAIEAAGSSRPWRGSFSRARIPRQQEAVSDLAGQRHGRGGDEGDGDHRHQGKVDQAVTFPIRHCSTN